MYKKSEEEKFQDEQREVEDLVWSCVDEVSKIIADNDEPTDEQVEQAKQSMLEVINNK